MSGEVKTVELAEPEVVTQVETKVPTREEMKSNGWSKSELDAAEKRGMISDSEEKNPEAKAEEKPAQVVEEKVVEKKEEKPKSSLPDFTISDPEKERVFLETFGAGTPQRAMYFRMKNERQTRQAAESRVRELEARLQAIEQQKTEKKLEVDENGQEIDPDDKPMTPKMFREMQQREAEERRKQEDELRTSGHRVSEAIKSQEEYARSIQNDFDDTVKLATNLIQNLDELVPDVKTQKKIIRRFQDLQIAAANADKLGLDDENASDIAYELGKFHPKYGLKTDDDGKSDRPETKANGSLTPEQMKRIEANTQRRASSASIPAGGGKRTVSVDDIGLKELNAMNSTERAKFKTAHPERYTKLMRG